MTKSSPPDFLWGHPRTPPLHLRTPLSSSSSPPPLQPSASRPLPWPWPPLLFWLSKPHALHDGLLLPLAVEGGTSAPPHASAAFQGPQCRFVKCRRGRRKT